MPISAGKSEKLEVIVNDRTDDAKQQIRQFLLEATTDVFVDEILPTAKALSPVGHEPVKPGSKRNRESLETGVWKTKDGGVLAKIWSTSGHGGFLEAGTKNMGAQPYVYPAVQQNISKIEEKVKEKVQALDEASSYSGA